ncbi:MAG TPA: hypothetical protein VN578_12825 [Candidatus Binatia bacterium]|jgi:hypothetical protein|nr:hypothetical protein [Candidatus Binatia bacterium]
MLEKRSATLRKFSRKGLLKFDGIISFLACIVRRDPQHLEALQILSAH